MKHTTPTLIATALTSVLFAASVTVQAAEKQQNEKCYGIVKSGKNDCQTSVSACSGTAKKDSQKDAWIYLPKGTCEKIVGASLTAGK